MTIDVYKASKRTSAAAESSRQSGTQKPEQAG